MNISVIFAVILMYFVVQYDWSKSKKYWVPYVATIFLTLFIIHNFLLLFNIDVVKSIQDKKVLETMLQRIGIKQ